MDRDACALLSSMSGAAQLDKLETSSLEEGGKCDMFKAIMDIREEGREEGRKEGREEGIRLVQILLKNGRSAEIEKAAIDTEYREKLYRELL